MFIEEYIRGEGWASLERAKTNMDGGSKDINFEQTDFWMALIAPYQLLMWIATIFTFIYLLIYTDIFAFFANNRPSYIGSKIKVVSKKVTILTKT